MSWIRTVAPKDARGLLAKVYQAAIERTGKIFNINRIQSLRPRVLHASTRLYIALMMQPEDPALSRAQREMIATTVSRASQCFY